MALKDAKMKFLLTAQDKVSGVLGKIGSSVAKFQNKMAQASAKSEKYFDFGGKVRQGAEGVATAREKMTGLFTGAIEEGRIFEKTMSTVQAVTKTTSEAAMKPLIDKARELGSTTSFSASEAAEGMTYLGMAGMKTDQILKAMKPTLDLAKAGNVDLATASDIASNMLSAFKLDASEMTRVADTMTKTFTASNVDLNMLAETFKYVAPVAQAAGASIEEVAAMTGILGDVGIQGSNAGTALRAAFLRLAKPPKMAAQALGELGVATKDSQGNLKAMPALLKELAAKMQGIGKADKLANITKIFGVEAAASMTALLDSTQTLAKNSSLTIFEQKMKNVNDQNQTAAKVSGIMGKNFDGAMKEMSSAMSELKLTVFYQLRGALTSIAGGLKNVATFVAKFAKENPTLTKTIIIITASITALLVVLTPLMFAISTIASGFAVLTAAGPLLAGALGIVKAATIATASSFLSMAGTALAAVWSAFATATGAVWAFTTALLMNPITWIVIGVMALIAAIASVIIYWDELKAKAVEVINKIKAAMPDWLTGLFGGKSGNINVTGKADVPVIGQDNKTVPVIGQGLAEQQTKNTNTTTTTKQIVEIKPPAGFGVSTPGGAKPGTGVIMPGAV